MGTQNNLVAKAVRYALATGMAATFVATPAFAADEEDDKIVITGSRIKRVDVEGPSPITVIDREAIEASGDSSVADVLRQSTFNSFGSFRERSGVGNGATGNAGISLRGLGSDRTLVLIDGKRAPSSPSSGGAGSANLNLIPIAAVERIEILRDGASAIYGSDAVAGVINIILRDDFDGLVLSVGAERPSQEGADAASFSLTGGVTSGKGNITYVLDHFERKELLNADRDFTSVGLSSFGFPGTFRVDGNWHADSRCPASLGSSTDFPNSQPLGPFCGFNYAATSASQAAIERDTLFLNSNYELSDNITFLTRTTISRSRGQGRYAPAPDTSSLNPPGSRLHMDADNALNPTANNPDFAGAQDITAIRFRNVPGGTRDTNSIDTSIDVLVGLEGANDWMGGTDWNISAHHARSHNETVSTGFAFQSAMQAAIDNETFDIFGVRGDSLDTVNAVAATFAHQAVFQAETVTYTLDGDISFELFEMAAGSVPIVLGFEYEDLNFFQISDPQTAAGNVVGTSGGDNVDAGRNRTSLYGEIIIPVLDNLELDIAVRYDDYSDFGDTVNPKISLGYRPTDTLLLRASYGEGFRAPTMTQLFGTQSQGFIGAVDTYGCSIGVPLACTATQYQSLAGGNPELDAETSESITAGIVFSPFENFSISLDYYDIELTDRIGNVGVATIMEIENNLRQASGGTVGDPRVSRDATGQLLSISRTVSNVDSLETSGYDLDVDYKLDAGNAGEFDFGLTVSFVEEFDQIDDINGVVDVGVGEFFTSGAAQPDYRANFSATWNRGDLGVNLQLQYTPEVDFTDQGIIDGNGITDTTLDEWTTIDLQITYATPWNGKITVGARNITDEDPPLNTQVLSSPFHAATLHDVFGRVPYIKYEQSF